MSIGCLCPGNVYTMTTLSEPYIASSQQKWYIRMVDGTTYVTAEQHCNQRSISSPITTAYCTSQPLGQKAAQQTKQRRHSHAGYCYYQDVTSKHVFMMVCKSRNKFRHRAIYPTVVVPRRSRMVPRWGINCIPGLSFFKGLTDGSRSFPHIRYD